MTENKLADLSTDFAVKILKLSDGVKGHYSLVNQLERSATSIGANIREARYAHSYSSLFHIKKKYTGLSHSAQYGMVRKIRSYAHIT